MLKFEMLWKGFTMLIFFGTNLISHSQCRYPYPECPDDWEFCGNTCYFVSTEKVIWSYASTECESIKNDSRLLILDNQAKDENIRRCLQKRWPLIADELWIDGLYNDKEGRWIFGATALPLQYQAFSRRRTGDDSKFRCIAMNREVGYRWSSMGCYLEKNFICEIH